MMIEQQGRLFDLGHPDTPGNPPPAQAFDGATYEVQRDYERLHGQLAKVFELMLDREWRTLAEIAAAVGGSEAAVSARLRDLRKPKYGAHNVERRHVSHGLFTYRLAS